MSDPSDVEARRVEGLAAAQEAETFYRELAASEPDIFAADLAAARELVSELSGPDA